MSASSSTIARLTISCLLKELEQKEETIKSLRLKFGRNTSADASSPGPIRAAQSVFPPAKSSHETDHVITELKSQVARMEYENARLRVDLQNK